MVVNCTCTTSDLSLRKEYLNGVVMIRYEDINLTAFCGPETMGKLIEHVPLVASKPFRAIKYEIFTIYESNFCEEGLIKLIKNAEFDKLEELKKEQKELDGKLLEFQSILKNFAEGSYEM
jgi:hypothetical protein